MASFTVLAAVLAAIAALVMFLSGELISVSPQVDRLSDTESDRACAAGKQGKAHSAAQLFRLGHRQECDQLHGLRLSPALTRPNHLHAAGRLPAWGADEDLNLNVTFSCSFSTCQSHPCCYGVACRDCSAAPSWFIFRAATSLSRWLRMLPRQLEPPPIAMLAELNGMMSSQVVSSKALSPALAARPSSKGRPLHVLHNNEPGLVEACLGLSWREHRAYNCKWCWATVPRSAVGVRSGRAERGRTPGCGLEDINRAHKTDR